jgi:hypothetical protein
LVVSSHCAQCSARSFHVRISEKYLFIVVVERVLYGYVDDVAVEPGFSGPTSSENETL